ncbi:uncharacterized protein LOC144710721 [Wolffia australiana]
MEQEEREERWEERSLNLLEDSKIDQEFSEAKLKKKGRKKHKQKWMKRPTAVPEVILEFLDEDLRENALRALANFLLDRFEENPEDYFQAGLFLFFSCSTMALLLYEVVDFLKKMSSDMEITLRSTKRLANVLTLFQSIAANKEIRRQFIMTAIPNFLMPIIVEKSKFEVVEQVRPIALSVIGILCQGRDSDVIMWATRNNVVNVCHASLKTGSELTKVIAMHILEYILRDTYGRSFICDPNRAILESLVDTWNQMVVALTDDRDLSPRLLFHVLRCYVLLCVHPRGLSLMVTSLPSEISGNAVADISEEFPAIQSLRCQLLNIGTEYTPTKTDGERYIER